MTTKEATILEKLDKIDLTDHFNPGNREDLNSSFKKIINEVYEYLRDKDLEKISDWQKVCFAISVLAYKVGWFRLCANCLSDIFEKTENISSEIWVVEKLKNEATKFKFEDIEKLLQ